MIDRLKCKVCRAVWIHHVVTEEFIHAFVIGDATSSEKHRLEEQFGAIMPKLQQARPTLFGDELSTQSE